MRFTQPLWRIKLGLGLITLSTLLLELSLVRVLDVILNPIMGYMVITATMFALGLGGIYVFVFRSESKDQMRLLPRLSVFYVVFVLSLLPVFNWLPFNLDFQGTSLSVQILSWTGMYLALIAPFFISGVIISVIFSNYSSKSHGLYFFDLCGAGIGCLLLVPLIPHFGPGGILFVVSGLVFMAGYLFTKWNPVRLYFIFPLLLVIILFPLSLDNYLEFRGHGNKRGIDNWLEKGMRDYVRWDPVSKLGVFNISPRAKNFALDGGQQGSWLKRFNANFVDTHIKRIKEQPNKYYYGLNSVVHYFKRRTEAEVLVIGAAAGSETTAALIFGAKHVDAIDLVEAMVDAVKGRYAEFSGGVFIHPKVDYRSGEGRTFLRSTDKRYDIIQMFSNHTSSSLAHGSGVLSSAYLQTAEAYMEYFQHLKKDGVLQINHHIYPRMIITATLGWSRLGRKDFARHVLVLERDIPDNLPTVLMKMSPWTTNEVEEIYNYMSREHWQGMPNVTKPSERIYANGNYRARFTSLVNSLQGISVLIGTYRQDGLDYDVAFSLFDADKRLIGSDTISGDKIKDNRAIDFQFPRIDNCKNKVYYIELSSDNQEINKGFSVWLTEESNPVMQTIPRTSILPYNIAFNPLDLGNNRIPARFLEQSFPTELAAEADYRMDPVTDDKPHFHMIRKSNRYLRHDESKYLDGGTAYFLNNQFRRFVPYDWISLFVVGAVSLIFSMIFIFVPLTFTSLRRARWKSMGAYLLYFSCLGAGFIIIELTFIQIFTKLIGFPTYTFATVIFALLFSAGLGSVISNKMKLHVGGRWKIIFLGILLFGIILVSLYPQIFHLFLGYDLPARILIAVAVIFPLGFFMGMPFPLGMVSLGEIAPKGIPWAWGMNGFFTVFGGYLGLVASIWLGFRVVLFAALGIYLIAFFSFLFIKFHSDIPPKKWKRA